MSRRRASPPTKPLDPKIFVQRLIIALGTDRARELVRHAFEIVRATGQPNRWIFEVKRARDRGAIPPALGRWLIFKLAESATIALTITHPVLSELRDRIEDIERAHGLGEDDSWHVDDGPAEWRALNREWEAVFDELLIDILLRNGEVEIAEAYAEDDVGALSDGAAEVFGADDSPRARHRIERTRPQTAP
ncbi:MAG TPA: hypothetical protein VN797_05670 [Gemmatimonadaceae bacterium]|nr:hypothetical protein [Gemmatimonadaceae bacterium]